MIIETDHMSVKARAEALTILEAAGYSGLITSHSWGDDGSQERLQTARRRRRPVRPRRHRRTSRPGSRRGPRTTRDFLFGVGYGSDNNGLGAQPGAACRSNARTRSTYPYTTFDGGTMMDRQRSGTRMYDVNVDGVAHYGTVPRLHRGPADDRR